MLYLYWLLVHGHVYLTLVHVALFFDMSMDSVRAFVLFVLFFLHVNLSCFTRLSFFKLLFVLSSITKKGEIESF